MGFYIDREGYFKGLAAEHHLVLDGKPLSEGDEYYTPVPVQPEEMSQAKPAVRRSFFRINDEEELLAACVNWIHFPCVVMMGYTGGLVNKDSSIRQKNQNTLIFLDRVILYQDNPVMADAISDTYDITLDVLQDFVSRVKKDYEDDEDSCGIFKNLEYGSFRWEQYGPVADNLYGWILVFSDETKPQQYKACNWTKNTEPELMADDHFSLETSDEDSLLTEE